MMSKNEIFKDFRLAHTMLRVLDLEASLKFYCEIILVQPLKVTSSDYVCDSCILPVSSI